MPRRGQAGPDLEALESQQEAAFGAGTVIADSRKAERFLSKVGVALRYAPTKGLPLASLYAAFGAVSGDKASLRPAIALTNQLLGEAHALEVLVIAERVTLVHRSLVPALYALVRRGRPVSDQGGLSGAARIALSLLRERPQVTAGDVRARLGTRFQARDDAAYVALGDLAGQMLVDRGPFETPKAGIPYLSTEGYPYHLVHEVHPELLEAARDYTTASAARTFLEAYVRGAVFARVSKLASLFKVFLTPGEIEEALRASAKGGGLSLVGSGRNEIAVSARHH